MSSKERQHDRWPPDVETGYLVDNILDSWKNVPERYKGEIVAILLDKSDDWNEWAVSKGLVVSWLRAKFQNVGIPCEVLNEGREIAGSSTQFEPLTKPQ